MWCGERAPFLTWEISGQKLAALMWSCYLVMDMLTDLFLAVFQQQPPSPWMHQRPPLSVDVNVGKSHVTLASCLVIAVFEEH